MNKLLDKGIVLLLCLAFYLQYADTLYVAVPVIVVISISALNSYKENDLLKLMSFIGFILLCFYFPVLLFFLPLFSYDLVLTRWQYAAFLSAAPIISCVSVYEHITLSFVVMLILLAWLMKRRSVSLEKAQQGYIELRDSAKELSLKLENKNKELMEKQDYEINLATLNERNRIARDIHDTVGHLLSSSILQIGALMATCKDSALHTSLNTLKETMTQGMNSVRSSIHDLYEDSVDLNFEVNSLVKNFQFCPATLQYDVESSPPKAVKYALIAVVKEALSNIIKHSSATSVTITLREHPALYQLIVKDNGTKKAPQGGDGIGLKNISERVSSLNGNVNISDENGFVVFISIPKE